MKFLDAFVDNELIEAAHARVQRHVEGCQSCAVSFQERVELKQLVKASVGNLTAPATLRDRLRARMGA